MLAIHFYSIKFKEICQTTPLKFFRIIQEIFKKNVNFSYLKGQSHDKVCEIMIMDVSFSPN
jgi:hypothetical protein